MPRWLNDFEKYPAPKKIPRFHDLQVPRHLLEKRKKFNANQLGPREVAEYVEGARKFTVLAIHAALTEKLHEKDRMGELITLLSPFMGPETVRSDYKARAKAMKIMPKFGRGGPHFQGGKRRPYVYQLYRAR